MLMSVHTFTGTLMKSRAELSLSDLVIKNTHKILETNKKNTKTSIE